MANRNHDARKRVIPDQDWLRKSREDVPKSNRPKSPNLLQQLLNQRQSDRESSGPNQDSNRNS